MRPPSNPSDSATDSATPASARTPTRTPSARNPGHRPSPAETRTRTPPRTAPDSRPRRPVRLSPPRSGDSRQSLTPEGDLARLLARVAADLDERGYARAGVVRRAARALLDGPVPTEDGCRGCGAELPQPVTGGRRVWCSERCRRRGRR